MSHFAKLDDNNIVINVVVAEQEHIDSLEGRWIQTSYNTRGGVHYAPNSNDPDGGIALRKNFAGIGYTYNESIDAFISPQPDPNWTFNETTCEWEPPDAGWNYPDTV
jgi:hypothetical protein